MKTKKSRKSAPTKRVNTADLVTITGENLARVIGGIGEGGEMGATGDGGEGGGGGGGQQLAGKSWRDSPPNALA